MSESFSDRPTEAEKKRLKQARNVMIGGILTVSGIGVAHAKQDNGSDIKAKPAVAVQPQNHVANQEAQPTEVQKPPSWMPPAVKEQWPKILQVAQEYDQDPRLMTVFVAEESMGNPGALNRSGAVGLMQIMPVTAEYIAQSRGIKHYNMLDPSQNLDFGAWYLKFVHDHYIQPNKVDPAGPVARNIYFIAMSGGVGDVEKFMHSGFDMDIQAQQTQNISQLWEQMYRDWEKPECLAYEKARGKF